MSKGDLKKEKESDWIMPLACHAQVDWANLKTR